MDDRTALRFLMARILTNHGVATSGDYASESTARVLDLLTHHGWTPPGAGYDDMLAHSVTATGGTVAAEDQEDVETIALTFHYGLVGGLAMHSQRFMAVDALRPLLDQLDLIARQLGI